MQCKIFICKILLLQSIKIHSFTMMLQSYIQGSHASWKVCFFFENSRTWKVLEKYP